MWCPARNGDENVPLIVLHINSAIERGRFCYPSTACAPFAFTDRAPSLTTLLAAAEETYWSCFAYVCMHVPAQNPWGTWQRNLLRDYVYPCTGKKKKERKERVRVRTYAFGWYTGNTAATSLLFPSPKAHPVGSPHGRFAKPGER